MKGNNRIIATAILMIFIFQYTLADEGMWMLTKLKQYNQKALLEAGCQLNTDEIYNADGTPSIKDAVVIFGRGCTGVTVSNQGLLFTNHHCGYGAIQKLSSVEHNYLKDGFAAQKLQDELPCEGLTVKYLVNIIDVTDRFQAALNELSDYSKRTELQDSLLDVIKKEYSKDNEYLVQVRSFYADNEFYVFQYEEFKDVRFAYAPPHAVGKFGGETDNWMWPRHTGDFSVFRVYANKDNKPAAFSKDNVPYQPKKFIPVSLAGYKDGDFAMIMGNPGRTNRYLTSWGISERMKAGNEAKIIVRGVKQDVWRSFMRNDEAINIAYASKYAGSSNYWKNSIGMNKALDKLKIIDRKKNLEASFQQWVNEDASRQQKYGKVLSTLEKNYASKFVATRTGEFIREAMMNGAEMHTIANKISAKTAKKFATDSILMDVQDLYKDYYQQVDMETMKAMLQVLKENIDPSYLPDFYQQIDKKFKGNYAAFVNDLYKKSAFSNLKSIQSKIKSGKTDFDKDPAIALYKSIKSSLDALKTADFTKQENEILQAEHLMEAGYKEIALTNNEARYPDANFTMRLTYGKVGGYSPADAVKYKYYSTTDGIMQKEIKGDMEFDVPELLKKAVNSNDFGPYADADSKKLHVAFLSNNDITGGNSGSPIFNAKGELLGLAFDGNWESLSGDLVFEPQLQRTINVDVRYMLFVMKHLGNAQRLLDELVIK